VNGIIIYINLALSFIISYRLFDDILLASVTSVVLVLGAYAFRTYEYESLESLNEQFVRMLVSTFFTALFVLLINSFDSVPLPNHKIIAGIILVYFALPFVNFLCYNLFVNMLQRPKEYLVIGRREEIGHILDEITQKSKGRYIFAEYINPSPVSVKEKIKEYDNILVANFELYRRARYLIEPYKNQKKIEYLSDLSEQVLKRIPLEVIDKFREYYTLEFEKAKDSPAKRILDILCGIVGIILFSPLIAIFSLMILIEDGPPVVFKQRRVGKNNKEFLLVKLRSMRKQTSGTPKFADQEKDRILRVGKIIRPTRIDESLQFWNILKGDMSIVGPRPEQIPFVREFEQKIPYYSYRHKLKPGLTGWAQIMYQYSSTLEEVKKKLEYDLYYIKNRSTLMDLRIILQTIEAIFWRRGAR